MAELIDMEKVAGRYQSKHDLMQDIPQRKNEKVDVRDHYGDDDSTPGTKGAKLGTPNSSAKSKSQNNTVNHKVENNFNSNNDDVEIQTKAITSQSQTLDAQTGLMKDQSHKLDNLNTTMEKLYSLLYREHTRPEPKYQQQATSPFPVKQNGMPDANGQSNSFADLASDVMDMMGGGKDKKGKGGKGGRKVPKVQTTGGGLRGTAGKMWGAAKSLGGSIAGLGGAGEGMGSRIMNGAKGMFSGGGGGGGWRGKLAKGAIGAGVAAVGYKGLESLGGLGSVSAMFESGKGGVGTISTGKGDNGGVSYGAHQLSSKSGTMAKFLRSEQGSKYADQFAGLQPGSAEFNKKYEQVVGNDSKGFEEAQAGFMKATHYDPAANKLAQDTGLDVSKRSRALQEMVYSTSTQYGGNSSVMAKALAGKDTASMSDADIISTVQDYKRDNVGTNFKSSSAAVQASVAKRAENEKKTLQKILDDEKKNPQGVMKGEDKKGVDGKTAADVASGKASPGDLIKAEDKPKGNEPIGIMPMKPQDIKADSVSDVQEDGTGAEEYVTTEQAGMSTVDKAGLGLAGLGIAKKGADVVGTKATTAVAEGAAKGAGRSMLRTVGGGVVNVGLSGLEAAEVINDDTMAKQQKQKSLVGIGGGMAGAAAGAEGGALVGAAIGAPFGGVGAIPGAAIGGFIGGTAGYFGGRALAEGGMDAALGTPEERQAKAAQGMYVNSPLIQGEHSTLPGAPVALPSVKDLMTVPSKAPTEINTGSVAAKPIEGETPIAAPNQTVTAETAAATLQPKANSLMPADSKPVPDELAVLKATTVPVAPGAPSFHKAAQAVAAKETTVESAPTAKVQTPATSPTYNNEMDVLKATTMPVAPGAPSFAKAAQAVDAGTSGSTDKLAQAAQSLADSAAKLAAGAGQQPQDGTKGNQPGGAAPGSPGMPTTAPAGMSALDSKPLISTIAASMNPFSPASPSFYNSEPAISQRPSMATPIASSPAPAVAQAAAPEAANRQPYDTVQNVRMAVDQPSAAPAPAAAGGGGKGGGAGGDSKGSDKPTLDEIPTLISDFGLVFVNSGFL